MSFPKPTLDENVFVAIVGSYIFLGGVILGTVIGSSAATCLVLFMVGVFK